MRKCRVKRSFTPGATSSPQFIDDFPVCQIQVPADADRDGGDGARPKRGGLSLVLLQPERPFLITGNAVVQQASAAE
jgi:hypothetical protein